MPNSSSTGGYIRATVAPVYDDDLDDIVHDVIMGITGIDGTLIRPRWQEEPPNRPDFTTNWVAFGVSHWDRDLDAHRKVLDSGEGSEIEKDEIAVFLVSFYGPMSMAYCTAFCDGLNIPQNRDVLRSKRIGLVNISEPRNLPALLKEKWVKRTDIEVRLRRRMHREYAIKSVVSADVDLNNEQFHTLVKVNQ